MASEARQVIFFLLRMGFGVVALYLVGRLIATAAAYRSWRTYGFFLLTVVSFVLIGFFRFSPSLGLDLSDSVWPPVNEVVFVIGVVGVLYETVLSDQRRLQDLQRLMDLRRRASFLAEKRLRELELLTEVTRELTASLNLRQVLQTVVDKALEFGDADGVSIFLRDPDTGLLTDYRITAAVSERYKSLPPPRPKGITAAVAQSGEAAFIDDVTGHPFFADGTYPELNAIASLPLKFEGYVIGVMNIGYIRKHPFDESAVRLLGALADAAALAVHNAEQHERIRRQAVTDELTGLANRRRFLESVRAEMQRARRYGHPLSLLMVDLDRLKEINDAHGHAAGDAMLRGVANCLRAVVRVTDVPARLGGDEFAVLMPETGREAALLVAERIRSEVEGYRAAADGHDIASTVSIGLISRDPGHLQDLPSLLHLADDALYKSKTSGRNQVSVWEPPAESPPAIDLPANSG
jgi:diguanylate cyclase (GGDEF)-like protein